MADAPIPKPVLAVEGLTTVYEGRRRLLGGATPDIRAVDGRRELGVDQHGGYFPAFFGHSPRMRARTAVLTTRHSPE